MLKASREHGIKPTNIQKVKQHLFYAEHCLIATCMSVFLLKCADLIAT